MLFTEPLFLFLFLPALLALYFVSPRRIRNPLLFAASLVFYSWGQGKYVIVLLLSILLNYSTGRVIGRVEEMKRRRLVLSIGIVANLLVLAAFKYPGFVALNLNRILGLFHFGALPVPISRVPLGISFFTLMGMSYVIDVYREQVKAERRLGVFSLYISFFPYLIAGPIVRYASLVKELGNRRVDMAGFSTGVRRFVVGMGKKMLIANSLALTVDGIFRVPVTQLTPGAAWLAAICYPIQLYFDISGYADMAIGLGLMFGFHLPENFNYPYVAQSLTEFWQRWHITLVQWFRDYLFYPMSYRRPAWRIQLNLIIVFVLCGLWHEGSWKFIAWGLMHGSLLAIERLGFARVLLKWPRPFRHLYVIPAIIVTCVFVRAPSLGEALSLLRTMIRVSAILDQPDYLRTFLSQPLPAVLVVGVLGCIPLVPTLKKWQQSFTEPLGSTPRNLVDAMVGLCSLAILALIFAASVALSAAGTYSPFIYFKY
jgi:alginate O-acetyltransferase complex protein AlgI